MARPKGKRPSPKQPPLVTDAADALRDADGLRPQERIFVEAYCGIADYDATKAYAIAGYKPNRHNANRLKKRSHIVRAILVKQAARLRAMDAEEVKTRIARFGRVDVRLLFPADHAIQQLPDDVALCIKGITPTRYGPRYELVDPLRALELCAKMTGILKETVKVEHALEDILSASWESPRNE